MSDSPCRDGGTNQDRMNFLFLNSARHGWGGNEKWTRLAAEALSASHGVSLAYRDESLGARFDVQKHRLSFNGEVDPFTIASLVRIIKRERIDVLIPTKRKDYVLAGIASRLTGSANVIRLGIDRPMKGTVIQQIVYGRFADGIIVNAEKILQTLEASPWIGREKIRVIYNGLDRKQLDEDSRQPYTKPFGFTIAGAGALISRKGFDYLIRAFGRFVRQCPEAVDAGLVIAGEGPERPELERLAQTLSLHTRVVFTGHLENPYPLMLASDLFVSASQSEGLSNALLESMYLGCLPISTRSGGADEVIADDANGFLIDYGDEERLALLMKKVYEDKRLRTAFAEEAKKTVTERFSIERMRDEIIRFCETAVARRRSA